MTRALAVVVLAAGLGTRTKVRVPKVLLPLCGRSLVGTVLSTVEALAPARTVVVLHHGKEQVEKALAGAKGLTFVDQGEPRGTGHAVQVAVEALGDFDGDVLVVYGDVPLITAETLRALCEERGDAAASILTALDEDPIGMGRILRDETGDLVGIREHKDCSASELEIEEFNAGFYCFDARKLPAALESLSPQNAQGELYLTDTVEWFLEQGEQVESIMLGDREEVAGVNTLADLSYVRAVLQERILFGHLERGVIIEDPGTTYIDQDVEIGANTRILPCTYIASGVSIAESCVVGPFSHLRASARLEEGAEVGNFVEVKKSVLGKGAKAKHLTYLGDAVVGAKANIGCGTITANYDGKHKHQTDIGSGAFIGSGTVLVAPSRVGDGAMTGAGAIVTRNTTIPDGEVYVGVPARSLADLKREKAERSEP